MIILAVILILLIITFIAGGYFLQQGNGRDGRDGRDGKDFSQKTIKKEEKTITYYMYMEDFSKSLIEIPSSVVFGDSTTLTSAYLAGRAYIYNSENDTKVGSYSATFLCIQNNEGLILMDVTNTLFDPNGIIATWFTPKTLADLEVDTIIKSIATTECRVTVNNKVGAFPFFGQTFNLSVLNGDDTISFKFTPSP